jgi:hypothetical protein
VLEELAKDLGQAAQVLGQLVSYESSSERLAVLEAGLSFQDISFARELLTLADEALQGFEGRGDVEPALLSNVAEIRNHTRRFIQSKELAA